MDTGSWGRERFELRTGITLDPKNVRLETADPTVEADIMEDLFANEGALSLVEGICAVGYLTHETPIVVKRDGVIVVAEGNRRMAALKAIQNPMLVPDFSHRISAMLERYPDHPVISEVEALVAPSQDEANQIIAAIHTGNLRRAWTPARQAAFFQAQIDAGREYEDLVKRYPTSDVKRFVFRARVVNRFKSAKYASPKLDDFVASDKFKKGLSTLTRVYEAKEFSNFTGLKMEDDGRFSMSVSDSQFDAIAAVIVRDMDEGTLNTRTLNTVRHNSRFNRLMKEVKEAAGAAASPSSETSASSSKADGDTSTTTTRPARGPKKKCLDVSRVKTPDDYGEGFKQAIEELSIINVQRCAAATFLLMRSALEKGIKSLADANGIEIKKSKSQQGYVYLRNCLEWLSDHARQNGDRWVVQVVRNMQDLVYYYPISGDKLNAVNHNHKLYVTPDQAFDMWRSVVSLLEYVVKPKS
jgi:hypothetical protein